MTGNPVSNLTTTRPRGAACVSWLFLIFWFLLPRSAAAHQASDGFISLSLTSSVVHARLDLSVRDLDALMGLDTDQSGSVTWGEVRQAEVELGDYVRSNLVIRLGDIAQPMNLEPIQIDDHEGGAHVVWQWSFPIAPSEHSVEVTYRCLYEVDALHRGFLKIHRGEEVHTAMLSPDQPTHQWVWGGGSSSVAASGWTTFVREGVVHIWTGYDHVLFLLALLLPAVLRRSTDNHRWEPVDDLRPAFWKVFKTVTAFTVAHSITLTVAVLGWVHLPSRLVESIIAASVILAALNNLKPWFRERGWMVAFIFGLIHGFGFAGVLGELDIQGGALLRSLLGFNLGVELGQAAIVSIFVPVAFMLRRSQFYLRGALQAGSIAIALLASVWLFERMTG